MNTRLYVGNLPYSFREKKQLEAMFSVYGKVESVRLMTDIFTGGPRRAAYVEMDSQKNALQAMAALNGSQIEGRSLIVNKNWGERKSPTQEIDKRDPLEESHLAAA